MPYPAKAIANFFIKKENDEHDDTLDILKLQKLIYLAHGWSLALLHKPLIKEKIKAWKYGPVVEEIYHHFKRFGIDLITEYAQDYLQKDNGKIEVEAYKPKFEPESHELLETVWSTYKKNTGIELSNWSHRTEGPWYKVWFEQHGFKNRSCEIPDEIIKNYFQNLSE